MRGEVMSISTITSNSTLNQANQTLQQDLLNLGTSLQSGNLSGAQQSFAQLLQDKQNINQAQSTSQSQGHHHHHHHHHATGNQQANSGQTSPSSSSHTVLSSAISGVSQSQSSTTTTS
jgi:hypothetical protein